MVDGKQGCAGLFRGMTVFAKVFSSLSHEFSSRIINSHDSAIIRALSRVKILSSSKIPASSASSS